MRCCTRQPVARPACLVQVNNRLRSSHVAPAFLWHTAASAHIHCSAGDLTPSNVLLTSAAKDPRRFICKVWFVLCRSTLRVDALQAVSTRQAAAPAPYQACPGSDALVMGLALMAPLVWICRWETLAWPAGRAACLSSAAATLAQVGGVGQWGRQ